MENAGSGGRSEHPPYPLDRARPRTESVPGSAVRELDDGGGDSMPPVALARAVVGQVLHQSPDLLLGRVCHRQSRQSAVERDGECDEEMVSAAEVSPLVPEYANS
ncbi:hypothetical protein DLE60_20205 [Micromonospora globispora]|uniref:Uncharacterized protein n=1 Tax=Micromonospora globispora TaxID=1450148 RepID=A0A317JY90_9ACTN|nr:hypothetical protein [Micromonospora globispora]PWU45729.1 hypothetical protein DLJ46_20510 [Micromonospora globispora]PWU58731.1 hypothetical protein DLE60_20205 [Micromonospora globispora]RQW84629.1 hypothetical protein DKL51_29750 [Micromonospora globispora]